METESQKTPCQGHTGRGRTELRPSESLPLRPASEQHYTEDRPGWGKAAPARPVPRHHHKSLVLPKRGRLSRGPTES